MAIQAQQFPVAAIRRIIVVIVVFVVNRQFAQARAGKLAVASPAYPRKQFERPFAIGRFAPGTEPARLFDNEIKPRVIGCGVFGYDRRPAGARFIVPLLLGEMNCAPTQYS